jgi:hypothetical protein
VLGTAGLAALDPSALCIVPVLALGLLLALRGYPGERVLSALRRASTPRPRVQRVPRVSRPARAAVVGMPRGGLLLARSLAVRPPPAALHVVA